MGTGQGTGMLLGQDGVGAAVNYDPRTVGLTPLLQGNNFSQNYVGF